MNNKIIKLFLFELKKNLINKKSWISNGLFILINMSIFPFTMNMSNEYYNQIFIPAVMTSILLGIVLITSNLFDEDFKSGIFEQYLVFGVVHQEIYLSKVIASSIEFSIIISIILPLMSLFYSISFESVTEIMLIIILSTPLLSSIGVFGGLLTAKLAKNNAISILLVFPLLISVLIILSLASGEIINNNNFIQGISYIKINIGLTFILVPPLCWLSKYL